MPSEALLPTTKPGSKLPSHRFTGSSRSQAEQSAPNLPLKAEHHFLPFSQSQLCLALSIQRSKPADVNTREYCLQLQKHIKQGKLMEDGEHRYIDTAEFWKDQYSKLHSEKKTMEVRLAQLEVLTDQNRTDGRTMPHGLENSTPRISRAAIIEPCSLTTTVDHQSDTPLHEGSSADNLPLLKQALVLHRLLRDDKVPADVLSSAIESSLSYMKSTISEVCDINSKRSDRIADSTYHISHRTFNTIAAIFNICLKGLAHLCRDIPGRRSKGQVIFSLVHFFVTALNHLHNMCLHQTICQAPNISKYQNVASHEAEFEKKAKTLSLLSGLTKFLVDILACPAFQKAHLSHIEVLEGMFSALLEEVGGLLSQAVFDDHLSASRRPGRVSSTERNALASINALAIDLKGQHLASVLKRAMKERPEKDQHSLAAMLAGTKVFGPGADKKVILARSRQRLQETLLKGVFGDDGDQFMDALQMPEPEGRWHTEAPQITRDERKTFVESVWSIVGWDMILNG